MTELHAKVKGQGDPVIVLHGLFGSAENLGGIARALSETYEVHSLDARNHGRSFHNNDVSYPAMASDVLAYMDGAGMEKAILLGHSMGGKTAMEVALTAPDRVAALVVADIAPVAYEVDRHGRIFEGMNAVDMSRVSSRADAEAQLAPYIEEDGVLPFLLTNLRRGEDGNYGWRVNLAALQAGYADIIGANRQAVYDGPVLFIKGGDSPYLMAEHRDAVLARFPKAQVKVIEGTGHWLHAQKPETFNRLVLEFLASA